MTEAEAYEAIAQRWAATWPGLQPTVPFALGNEAVPPPTTPMYVTLTFGALASKWITQGAPGTRTAERRGTINVKLFGAVDAGDNPLTLLMGSVRKVLEGQSIGVAAPPFPALQLDVVSDSPPAKQGSWYTKTATVPFVFYELT